MGESRAMMLTAGFSQQDKGKFWCEVNKIGQYHGKERKNQASLHIVLQ